MNDKGEHRPPQIVFENGKPSAVIIDIDEYRELLERVEDAYDLRQLDEMRKGTPEYRSLDEFLAN